MLDTIVAISTTMGVGAISIIRVSGKDSINVVNKCFKGKDLTIVNTHSITYGYIVSDDEIVDEVLVSVMKAPKSFTMEDVVEINCHGGVSTTKKVLEIIINNGARLAEPGEFTKRAFLNGRIDLTQAESIMDLINSESDANRKVAMNALKGNTSNLIKKIRQDILELLASIEVNIDYPEYDDAVEITNLIIEPKLLEIKKKLERIITESESKNFITSGIKTVIIGRPNVGKSSILNKLINEDKAIVTNIEGTTRDIVEGSVSINGVLLNIIDTAGIRESNNIVEKIGINKSLEIIEQADLVVLVLNNNDKLTLDDKKIFEYSKNKTVIVVINKNDLDSKIEICDIPFENIVYCNTVEDDGIDNLKNKIIQIYNLNEIYQNDNAVLNNVRQVSLAKESLYILNECLKGILSGYPVDIVEIDIKRCWKKLGEIIGETYNDELLDQLFSQFCLGK